MKDEPQKIDIRILDRLYGEHVVRHELDSVLHILPIPRCNTFNYIWEVLNHEYEMLIFSREVDANMASGTSNIDNFTPLRHISPVKIVAQRIHTAS